MRLRMGAAWVVVGLLLAGCGPSLPRTVPVTGTVTLGGEPVEGVRVTFSRGGGNLATGELAIGTTDATGRFTLTTHFGSDGSASGAVPGDYTVTVSKMVPPAGMSAAAYQALVDAAKEAGERGEMVPPSRQPPPLAEKFPRRYSVAKDTELKAPVSATSKNDFTFALVP